MADRARLRFGRLIVGALGFGLLMGNAPPEATFWRQAAFASAAGAWLVVWWPWVEQEAAAAASSAFQGLRFVAGAAGYGLLMGLRAFGANPWSRALIAGAAMVWLLGLAGLWRKRVGSRLAG